MSEKKEIEENVSPKKKMRRDSFEILQQDFLTLGFPPITRGH